VTGFRIDNHAIKRRATVVGVGGCTYPLPYKMAQRPKRSKDVHVICKPKGLGRKIVSSHLPYK
jgi:hypothetical protein